MKFNFSLQKVLQHRAVLEDLAQKDFQDAVAENNQANDHLNALIEEKRKARERAFRMQVQGGQAGATLTQVHEFLTNQDIRIERQRKVIAMTEQKVEKYREILRQKAIDRKMIESLREKKKEEFRLQVRKLEQKAADDLSTMRFKRRES